MHPSKRRTLLNDSSRFLRIGFILCVLSSTACRNEVKVESGPRLFPVVGSLRIDGAIPTGATIRFHSPQAVTWGRTPMAIVEPDGTFRGSFAAPGDGVPAGEYGLIVYWMALPEGGGLPLDRLQGRFSDTQKPAAKVTIEQGENRLPPIVLSTKSIR